MNNQFKAIIAIAAVVYIALLIYFSQAPQSDMTIAKEVYTVRSGDTLWEIADGYCPDTYDKRIWIDDVIRINGMDDAIILPGDALTVIRIGAE